MSFFCKAGGSASAALALCIRQLLLGLLLRGSSALNRFRRGCSFPFPPLPPPPPSSLLLSLLSSLLSLCPKYCSCNYLPGHLTSWPFFCVLFRVLVCVCMHTWPREQGAGIGSFLPLYVSQKVAGVRPVAVEPPHRILGLMGSKDLNSSTHTCTASPHSGRSLRSIKLLSDSFVLKLFRIGQKGRNSSG